ncbi:complex I NDUFA9 subunit family protein [Croceicoccus estronivorus]|uniref:complex I NDUFA9 subunit family protein n=1 Tax=Croceicoccus estronivorus TaxID=1172626 RepID=UPI000A4E0FB3|nr:complex I NDUFA9 subunit family protein [Croceicoccus estronivorus]
MAKTDPLDGKLVVLLGGSGMLGSHVAQELLARGARLRIASRHPERGFRLKPLAKLGQIQFVRCDVAKPASIFPLMNGADAAVYLAGTFDGDLDAVHAHGAGNAAQAAAQAGAGAFVHISAIGADGESDVRYARTKADGEKAVRAAFPKATILRPSILFGEDDHFINMFAGLIAALPVMPVFAPTAKIQPLHVDDAARAIVEALVDPTKHGSKTYEIAGPEAYDMAKLNRMIASSQGRERMFMELPDAVSGAIAALTGWLPGAPLSTDQWKLLKAGNVPSGQLPGLQALGIAPRPLELFLDRWMLRYRKHGRFGTSTNAA